MEIKRNENKRNRNNVSENPDEESKVMPIGKGGGSFGNLLGAKETFEERKVKRTDSSNPSIDESFFAGWDLSVLPMAGDQ